MNEPMPVLIDDEYDDLYWLYFKQHVRVKSLALTNTLLLMLKISKK